MKEADEPGSHIYDIPEEQKGDPEIFAIEQSLQEIRLKYLLPINDASESDREQLEDDFNQFYTETTRAIVQLEAFSFDPDEVDAVLFSLDVLNAISVIIDNILNILSNPDISLLSEKEHRDALNSSIATIKNLFDIPQSILFLINAGRGETLGLDKSVLQTNGSFGQLGRRYISPSDLHKHLLGAYDIMQTALEVNKSQQRARARLAGESINKVLTEINGAFDFEQLGGRLQRAFHFIGATQFAALEELISLYDFPKDMFYTTRDTKGYQTEHIGKSESPRLGLGRLLQHLERSMTLLNLAQRVADRHTKAL